MFSHNFGCLLGFFACDCFRVLQFAAERWKLIFNEKQATRTLLHGPSKRGVEFEISAPTTFRRFSEAKIDFSSSPRLEAHKFPSHSAHPSPTSFCSWKNSPRKQQIGVARSENPQINCRIHKAAYSQSSSGFAIIIRATRRKIEF